MLPIRRVMNESPPPPPAEPLSNPVALCPACGYDLRGLPAETERCPECGMPAVGAAAAVRVPWEMRREMGRWRAYRRTAWLALFHPARLAAAIARPVRFEDARRFSRATAFLAWTPLALLLLWTWL